MSGVSRQVPAEVNTIFWFFAWIILLGALIAIYRLVQKVERSLDEVKKKLGIGPGSKSGGFWTWFMGLKRSNEAGSAT